MNQKGENDIEIFLNQFFFLDFLSDLEALQFEKSSKLVQKYPASYLGIFSKKKFVLIFYS